MNATLRHGLLAAGLLTAATAATAAAQQLPPVRPLGATVARSTEPLGSVSTAVPLPSGKVLVNDILKRRVLLFDSTLTDFIVVADSTSSTANAYGGRTGGLLAYRGDSALFVDPASMSMLVIDPAGKITRVMSAPRPQDVGALIGGPSGVPGFDANGRLVYRAQPAFRMAQSRGSGPPIPEFPDSAPVVRFDLAARKLDTVAFHRLQRPNITVSQLPNGGMTMTSRTNPLPTVDDWALLADGTVAIVRGNDYSVDWIAADGSRSSSGRIPYEWQRLDEDGKMAVLDSARVAMEKTREMAMARMQGGGAAPMMMGPGGGDVTIVTRGAAEVAAARGGGGGGAPPQRGGAGTQNAPPITLPPINMIDADELPDYRPPFTAGSSRGDLEGNLWVRTTSPVGNAGPIYYVINREGKVIDRVQLPEQRLIAGFGHDGTVFLALRDAEGNARVERARIK